jgi:hypothetical protein
MSSYGAKGDDYADSEEEMNDFYSGIEKYDDEYGDDEDYEEEEEEEEEEEDY